MITEIKDNSEVHNRKYHIFETEFPKNSSGKKSFGKKIYGICFSPPAAEPVMLCFLSNGRMANPFRYDCLLKSKNKDEKKLFFCNFTKTQFAGIELHKIIIHLLRYVSKKYFKKFSLTDEGYYWETNNEKLSEEKFKEYGCLFDSVCEGLHTQHLKAGESVEEYLLRIFNEIHLRRKNKT